MSGKSYGNSNTALKDHLNPAYYEKSGNSIILNDCPAQQIRHLLKARHYHAASLP
ncbi:hypothetical protein [Syntrophaceticus schinkii]|uniref:hypothetical protein n=1 Tax=Syntrophaceticus schinkii TaxID=499207 RepID=UPI0018DB7CA4|nr:hypothetical protein [Syntrophaceticus schinkii]